MVFPMSYFNRTAKQGSEIASQLLSSASQIIGRRPV